MAPQLPGGASRHQAALQLLRNCWRGGGCRTKPRSQAVLSGRSEPSCSGARKGQSLHHPFWAGVESSRSSFNARETCEIAARRWHRGSNRTGDVRRGGLPLGAPLFYLSPGAGGDPKGRRGRLRSGRPPPGSAGLPPPGGETHLSPPLGPLPGGRCRRPGGSGVLGRNRYRCATHSAMSWRCVSAVSGVMRWRAVPIDQNKDSASSGRFSSTHSMYWMREELVGSLAGWATIVS